MMVSTMHSTLSERTMNKPTKYYIMTYPNNGAYGQELSRHEYLTEARTVAKLHTKKTGNETEVCRWDTDEVESRYQA